MLAVGGLLLLRRLLIGICLLGSIGSFLLGIAHGLILLYIALLVFLDLSGLFSFLLVFFVLVLGDSLGTGGSKGHERQRQKHFLHSTMVVLELCDHQTSNLFPGGTHDGCNILLIPGEATA